MLFLLCNLCSVPKCCSHQPEHQERIEIWDRTTHLKFDSAQKGQFDQSCQPRMNKPLNFGELPQRIVVQIAIWKSSLVSLVPPCLSIVTITWGSRTLLRLYYYPVNPVDPHEPDQPANQGKPHKALLLVHSMATEVLAHRDVPVPRYVVKNRGMSRQYLNTLW